MPFQPGENVGQYRIIEQLGQGGMATVFKAYHPALDRYVALKVMHPAFMQDPQFLRRFEREAKVVARLDHPNIVPVYDFADHLNQPFLVMKFVEGETLKAALDRGWPAKERILEIVRATGNALSYAHDQGVLHRDIKPSNILLAEAGGVFLTDFGLARMAEAGQSTLSGDQLLGTPHYISPEQARGEQNLDAGTDIYSLGIVLYQLCVGRVPFNSDTPFSIIHDHIYTVLPLPSSINAKIPKVLENVLLKALAKDRQDRFKNVAETVQAFERAVQGISPWGPPESLAVTPAPVPIPAPARPAVTATTGTRPARRARSWVWVAAGLLMTTVCLASFLIAMGGALDETAAAAPQSVVQPIQSQPVGSPIPQLPDAVAAADESVSIEPNSPKAHMELAGTLKEAGETERAVGEFTRAAELYLEQSDYIGASEALLAGLELSGANLGADPRLAGMLTQALFLGAESGQMMPYLDRVSQLYPEWPPFPVLKARSLLYLGELDAAKVLIDRALQAAPEDPTANAVMIDGLRLIGEPDEARAATAQLLERRPLPPWLVKHLQEVQAELGS
jgi:tRNA A-37 threonylcarbamoyl transferase component Bud32/tetratricopeptide (TPR) repeat protein